MLDGGLRRTGFLGRQYLLVTLALVLFACVDVAEAAFPGANGKIAFSRSGDIYTVNVDGTGETRLTSAPEDEIYPSWSPDGQKIAFSSSRGIDILNVQTGGLTNLNPSVGAAHDPSWSPDGQMIAFIGGTDNVYTMNANGTSVTQLTSDANGGAPTSNLDPVWSPDGSKIAFYQCRDDGECLSPPGLRVMDANGSNVTEIVSGEYPDWSPDGGRIMYSLFGQGLRTINPDGTGSQSVPGSSNDCCGAWSPDSRRIAFVQFPVEPCFDQLLTMNLDGTGRNPLACGFDPDWQPFTSSYPRPNGAAKVRVTFVPAFRECAAPGNTSHGSPLALDSCEPAQQLAGFAGIPNDDSSVANGSATYRYLCTNGGSPPSCGASGDQADVALIARHTDVRQEAALALDYAGELEARVELRITDSYNGFGGGKATAQDLDFSVTLPCAPTPADPATGSLCSVNTRLDAVLPGVVQEDKRAIWEMKQIRLYDGGTDADGDTTADNTLFAVQGIAIP